VGSPRRNPSTRSPAWVPFPTTSKSKYPQNEPTHRLGQHRGDVETSGAVRFDDLGTKTGVEETTEYAPPAGAVEEAVTKVFSDPQDKVQRAAAAFKETIESAS
jgi:uncharacterized membrane protein